MKRAIILNADDLGLSAEVNGAIKELFQGGLISSATLMVTSPNIHLLDRDFFGKLARSGCIGLHVDLREFRPLNGELLSTSICNSEGFFSDIRKSRLSIWKKILCVPKISREIDCQILRFEELMGCKPSHIDSHGHAHTYPLVFAAILLSSRARSVGKVRRAREYLLETESGRWTKGAAKAVFNFVLSLFFSTTDHFIGIRKISDGAQVTAGELERIEGTVEIMCHPSLSEDTEQHEEYLWLKKAPYSAKDMEMISYSKID